MSDPLIVTFQAQLSDVMEAVVKTAMFEVTRLVEDVFMMQVRRSKQELDSLRLQLQWTRSKTAKTEMSVESARNEADQSSDAVEARAEEQQDDTMGDCDVRNPGDAVEHWLSNCREECKTEPADNPATIQSPGRESEVHFSVFKNTNPPQVTRCTVCCVRFHCPLCPAGMYKPRSKAMVLQHLEVHKKNALQREDFYITKCHHACRPGKSGHFHCLFCSRTTVKRQDAERHLKICRPLSVLIKERPEEKMKPHDSNADRQENISTGDCRKVPESPLPSNASLDNPPYRVLSAKQTSVLCHHCHVKILKKNIKKHINRKHMNIPV